MESVQATSEQFADKQNRVSLRSQLLPNAQHVAAGVIKTSNEYDAFLAKQLSPQTRRAYAADMKHFLTAVGITDPRDLLTVDTELLIEYRNSQIDDGLAPATIARRLSTLRSFFDLLVTLGRISRNPANPKLVRNPRVPRDGVTPGIEPHEARKLLDAPDTAKLIGKRDRAILAVGLYMGLRRDEIARLNRSAIRDERGHHVLETRGKGGKTRVLPIPPIAWAAIQDYLKASESQEPAGDIPLFKSMGHSARTEKRLSGQDIRNIVQKYVRLTGVNCKITTHSMRVAAITAALDHGAPIHRVQLMAGHADPRTTTRYYRQGKDLDDSATYLVSY